MANTKFWKVWLKPNLLTKDVDNDYIAEVSTSKQTLRNEDIAQRIVDEGSEIKYDTLLSIINQHDRIIREAVCDGYSVLTGVAQFSPRVTGNWLGKSANFDPSTKLPARTSSSRGRKSRLQGTRRCAACISC